MSSLLNRSRSPITVPSEFVYGQAIFCYFLLTTIAEALLKATGTSGIRVDGVA